jgi:hypothetical protein
MRIQKATKFDVRMKPQIQITGPNATLRLIVANDVRRNAAPAQRRAVRLSNVHMKLKPLLNSGASHRPHEAIGHQRLI